MFERLIRCAIEQRWLHISVTLTVAPIGLYHYPLLTIVPFPQLTHHQDPLTVCLPYITPPDVDRRHTFTISTPTASHMPFLSSCHTLPHPCSAFTVPCLSVSTPCST
ncbi:hypothetical protein HGQ98_28685, partial [Achromobacter ruhlandii]